MSKAHVNQGQRACGATTITTGQNFVTINGKAWAIEGDMNSHGQGALIASKHFVTINNKAVIVVNDTASPDSLCPSQGGAHCNPYAVGFDTLIDVG